MCLAIPGKVVSVSGHRLTVAYPDQTRPALVGDEEVKPGDYVLIQMGVVVRKLSQKEAKLSLQSWKSVTPPSTPQP